MRYNRAIFVGHIGADAVLVNKDSFTVANFRIAVNSSKKDGEPLWVACSLFGERASKIASYLTRGKPVLVDGEVSVDQYTSRGGEQRSGLHLRVHSMQLLGSRDASTPGASDAPDTDDMPF